MPINPAIPLSVQPPRQRQRPISTFRELSQLKNVQQQGKIQGMQIGQMEATQGRADAVRKILSQGLDPEQAYQQLLQADPNAAAKFQQDQLQKGMAELKILSGIGASMKGATQEERQAMGRAASNMFRSVGHSGFADRLDTYEWTDTDVDLLADLSRESEDILKGKAPLKVGATERVFAEGGAGKQLVGPVLKERERKSLGQSRIVGPDGKAQEVQLLAE